MLKGLLIMKKVKERFKSHILILIMMLCVILSIPVNAAEYTVPSYNVRFTLPEGMNKVDFSEDETSVSYKFESMDNGTLFFFFCDAYEMLDESEKEDYLRYELCNSSVDENYIREMIPSEFEIEQIKENRVGENFFWTCDGIYSYLTYHSVNGQQASQTRYTPGIVDVTIENGYFIMFLHYDYIVEEVHNNILESLDLSAIKSGIETLDEYALKNDIDIDLASDEVDWWEEYKIGSILVGILLTALIYMVYPIIRLILNKGRFSKEIAKKIALWNSIIAGGLCMILTIDKGGAWSAGPAFLYYGINRLLLTKKGEKQDTSLCGIAPEENTKDVICQEEAEPKDNHHQEVADTKQEKLSWDIETMGEGLAQVCSKEYVSIIKLCSDKGVAYDISKLAILTYAYFYQIWIYNFENITARQADALEKEYIQRFSEFNRNVFGDEPFTKVIENEKIFVKQLKLIGHRISESYDREEKLFVDDGISDEFILGFIEKAEDKDKIKDEIVIKVLKDWALVASKAGEQCLIK